MTDWNQFREWVRIATPDALVEEFKQSVAGSALDEQYGTEVPQLVLDERKRAAIMHCEIVNRLSRVQQ